MLFRSPSPAPPPAPRAFEPVVFWVGIVAGSLAALFGTAGIIDAMQSSPSGEWSGLGVLATFVVDGPIGLALIGVAFTQRVPRRRWGLLLLGLALLALPFLAAMALQHRRTQQRRETEERVQRRMREAVGKEAK